METTMAIGSSVIASLFSHVFCCGLLPFALNASASVFLSGLGMQIGFAMLTLLGVATGVTFFEKHRHVTACASGCGCVKRFDFQRHFARNLLAGLCAYGFFTVLTHIPAVHHGMEQLVGIKD